MDIDTYLSRLDRLEADHLQSNSDLRQFTIEPDFFKREDNAEYFYQEWVRVLIDQEA